MRWLTHWARAVGRFLAAMFGRPRGCRVETRFGLAEDPSRIPAHWREQVRAGAPLFLEEVERRLSPDPEEARAAEPDRRATPPPRQPLFRERRGSTAAPKGRLFTHPPHHV